MKKLFAILMSIMMIACFMPTMAFAVGGETGDIITGTGDQIGVSGSFTDGGTIASDYKTATFPSAEYQYQAAPATLTVTIKNTTSEAINNLVVAITGEDFEITQPSEQTLAAKTEQAEKSTTFTVKPKQNLSAGNHTATVTIKGNSPEESLATFTVSFEVTQAQPQAVAITATPETLTFDSKIEGYEAAPEAQTVTITNTSKNTETGALTVALPVGNEDFNLTNTQITTIAAGENATFTVQPKTGLGVGTHTATVTISGAGITASKTVNVSFEVTQAQPQAVAITATPETLTFDSKIEGYEAAPEAQTVTITNTSKNTETGALTVALPVGNEDFNLTNTQITTIAAGENATFTVQPKTGLGVGTHTATVTISGAGITASKTVNVRFEVTQKPQPTASATVSGNRIEGETKVTLAQQTIVITLANGPTFKGDVEGLDVNKWFAEGNLPAGLNAKITEVKADKTSATITLSGIPTVKSEADILITIPKDSLVGAAADMTVNMQKAKYAIKEFYMPTGGGGGGAAAKPTKPTTPEQKPATAAGKTAANTAITTAAAANKYDKAEQAEVDQIVKEAEAKIKEAKTEDEVKAIQKDAETKLDKILTTEEKATIASLEEVSKRDFGTKSKKITKKNGKKAVKLSWAAPEGVDVDGYEIFRSTKKNSGYGTEPYFETPKTSYTNSKGLKSGKTYYYKVRAYVEINGERHYTDYSTKASRKI